MLGLWHSSFLSPSFLQVSGWGPVSLIHTVSGGRGRSVWLRAASATGVSLGSHTLDTVRVKDWRMIWPSEKVLVPLASPSFQLGGRGRSLTLQRQGLLGVLGDVAAPGTS